MNERNENERQLAEQFADEEFRRAWSEDFVNTTLALQIAALRRQRGWNQAELAKRAGTTQSAISRMEDVEYGSHSLRVLKQIAAALDLPIRVSFGEWGTLIRESEALTEEALQRSSFQQDPLIREMLGIPAVIGTEAPVAALPDEPVAEPMDPDPWSETMETAVAADLPERSRVLRKWLMGYGIGNQNEPAFKAIYYRLPADARHKEWSARVAEACVDCFTPEAISELAGDPVDGERAL